MSFFYSVELQETNLSSSRVFGWANVDADGLGNLSSVKPVFHCWLVYVWPKLAYKDLGRIHLLQIEGS